MKLTQEQIDKIHRISDRCIKGIILGGFVILFLKPGNWFWWVAGISLAVAIVVNTIVGHWATDEEKEQRIAELKEAIQEAREEDIKKKSKAPQSKEEVECPLIDVNDRQKEEIIELLKRRITTHEKDSSRFSRSVVYTYLSALRALHVIVPVKNSDDIDARRRWIEQITGLYEPQNEWAHFRGDYDEFKHNNKVKAAIKEIESKIEKFR